MSAPVSAVDPTLVLLVAATLYGPLLITIAVSLYAASLGPARANALWLDRAARRPLFWMLVPPLLAAFVIALLNASVERTAAIPSGPPVTLTKTTAPHFTAFGATLDPTLCACDPTVGTLPASDQLALRPRTDATPIFSLGPELPVAAGEGAHAIAGNAGEFLVPHGGLRTSSSIYSDATGTFRVGPTFATPIGKGAFSLPRGDGSFLLVAGGDADAGAQPLKTFVVTPAATAGGPWTVVAGPDLAATPGAGLGAHAVKFSAGGVTKFLIVHGAAVGNRRTSVYTPSTNAIVAGPDLVDGAGTGAHAIPRPVDGKSLIVIGAGTNRTNVFDPATTTFAGGPNLQNANVAGGGHAYQYRNAAGQERYLIVQGGGSDKAQVYDPNALPATTAGMIAGITVPIVSAAPGLAPHVNTGATSFLRADGTIWLFHGDAGLDAAIWNPKSATNGAFTAVAPTNALAMGAGSFALQQSDGRYLVFAGGTNDTRYAEAGWSVVGRWTSEAINPRNVDHWTSLSWNRGALVAGQVVDLAWRTAPTADGLAGAPFSTVPTTAAGGSAAITSPVANKWAQLQALLRRPVPQSTAAEERVWLGPSSVVQVREIPAADPVPTLLDVSLGYTTGVFVLFALSPQTAGAGFPLTIELRDSLDSRISDYQGNHTLVFAGASLAPDGASQPTATDRTGAAVRFGQPTGLTFAATGAGIGTATPTLVLVRKEEIDLTVTESVSAPGPFTTFALTSATIPTGTPAHVLVNAGPPSATKSTIAASPAIVKPDNVATSTITVTVTDAFGNVLPGRSVTLASSRGALDTFSATPLPPTDFGGRASGTVRSATPGDAVISATVAPDVTLAATATVRFVDAQQQVTLTKRATAHFGAAGAVLANLTATGAGLAVATTPETSVVSGAATTGAVGAGAHTLEAATGERLILHGGGSTTSTVYGADGVARAGPSFGVAFGDGALSMPRADGSFLLVAGGGSAATFVVTPAATAGGAWSAVAGPTLAAPVGGGAHAIPRADGTFLLVHGGGSAATTVYTPGTNAVAAGPALGAAAGAGAHAIPRADGTFLVVLGGGSAATRIYDPVANTTSAGPTLAAAVGAGGHAIEYRDATGARRFLVVSAGGLAATTRYDAGATPAATAGASAGPSLPATAGAGAHTILRADGTFLTFLGGASAASALFTPAAESFTTATLAGLGALGAGAHSFPDRDARYVIVGGGGASTTARHNAGWTGTYESEPVNPTSVDRYHTLAWERTADGSVTVGARTATTSAGLAAASFSDVVTGTAPAGSSPLAAPTGNRWAQLRATLGRAVTPGSGAQRGVWLGSSSVAQDRAIGASPFVTKLQLGLTSGAFALSATSPQTAGVAFGATLALRDSAGATITDYAGTHTLVFAGAAVAPDGTSAPTATNAAATAVAFGSGTSVSFTSGGATVTLRLTAAETAQLQVSETVTSPGPFAAFELATHRLETSSPATVVVQAAAPDAATSSLAASPTNVPADDLTTASLTATVRDAFRNPVPGRTVTLLSSRASPPDTLVQPPPTDAAGRAVGGIRSRALGSSVVTARVALVTGFVDITQTATVIFGAGGFLVVTQNGGTETAGVAFSLTITAVDSDGATVTTYAGAKSISFSSDAVARTSPVAGPAAVIPASLTVTFASGVGTTSASFTLYNSAQRPTISAVDGVFPAGSSAPITVMPAAPSTAVATIRANPDSVAADGRDAVGVFVTVLDAFGNPVPGRTVTLASSRGAQDTIVQPSPSNAQGVATGQVRSTSPGCPVITATIVGVGQLTATEIVCFGVRGQATRLAVATQRSQQEVAGQAFSITITARRVDDTIDVQFCRGPCTVTITSTALPSPTDVACPNAGAAPTGTITLTNVRFSFGVFTTSAPNLLTFTRASQSPLATVSAEAFEDVRRRIAGTSPGVVVAPDAPNLACSLAFATPSIVPADNATAAALTATVVDRFANAVPSRSVTFGSSRAAGTDTIVQPASATNAFGGASGSVTSATPGAATITASVVGAGAIANTATVQFFGGLGTGRVESGTRLGTVENGVAEAVALTVIPRDAQGRELPTPWTVTWSVSGAGSGVFTTPTTSDTSPTTFFEARRAGSATVTGSYVIPAGRPGAGTVVNLTIPVTVVSHFDVKATTGNGRAVTARVEWDGATLRVLSWVTTGP